MSKKLFEQVYQNCQKWHLRPFTFKERCKDFSGEFTEFFEAVFHGQSLKEIKLEYADIIFSFGRHGLKEKPRFISRLIFNLLPFKKTLILKMKIYDERHDWWLKNHGFHSIRNYHDPHKRARIIKIHENQ